MDSTRLDSPLQTLPGLLGSQAMRPNWKQGEHPDDFPSSSLSFPIDYLQLGHVVTENKPQTGIWKSANNLVLQSWVLLARARHVPESASNPKASVGPPSFGISVLRLTQAPPDLATPSGSSFRAEHRPNRSFWVPCPALGSASVCLES